MSTRISSSLKWLIDKRARLAGEIERTAKVAKRAAALVEELRDLERTLAAIDESLKLHEVQIEVDYIKPVRSIYRRMGLPHGELTRSILCCLKAANGQMVSTTQITAYVTRRSKEIDLGGGDLSDLRNCVRMRLKNLSYQGLVKSHRPRGGPHEGYWTLGTAAARFVKYKTPTPGAA
jgi:hypothetical protein